MVNEAFQDDLDKIEPFLRRKKEIQQFPSVLLPLLSGAMSTELMKENLGFAYDNFYFEYIDGHVDMCYFTENNISVTNEIEKRKSNDKNFFNKTKKEQELIFENQWLLSLKKKNEYLKTKSEEKLFDWLSETVLLVKKAVGYGHMIEAFSMIQTHSLKDQLAKKIKNPLELSKILNILTLPEKNSFVTDYQLALKKAFKTKDDKKLKKELEKIMSKFYWIGNSYSGRAELTINSLLEQRDSIFEIKKINIKEIIQQKNDVIKKYKLNKEDIRLAQDLSFLTIWQDERKKMVLRSIDEQCMAIKFLSQKIGLDENLLTFLTPEEIAERKFLESEIEKILTERKKYAFVFYNPFSDKKYRTFTGDNFREKIAHILKEKDDINIDSIYGAPASSGKVIGRVQICKNMVEINNFVEGNVLVASMTRPEYLSAMKKSIAVVTDEGGVTCHAAIISRELGIPCVTGTKNATKILQNGDLVEVRANHGQVVILEKAEENKMKI